MIELKWVWEENNLISTGGEKIIFLDHDSGCGDPECCGERTYWIGVNEKYKALISKAPQMADEIERLKAACHKAIKWIKDANKMMNTKGCGWTDASDSLKIGLRELEDAISIETNLERDLRTAGQEPR